jgi:hypothetical protein
VPTKFLFKPRSTPENDILSGLDWCETTLKSGSDTDKAVALAYLIHLMGDLHQPLHCASLFNDMFPDGDMGGNKFWIKVDGKGDKLHSIWDDLLGTTVVPTEILKIAAGIEKLYPKKSVSKMTMEAISKETRMLAVSNGYLKGKLVGSASAGGAVECPAGYIAGAKKVAVKQVSLAGYRLAAEVHGLLTER